MSNTKKELLTKDLILKEFDELWKIIFQAYTVFKTVGDPIKLEDLQHDEINSWLSNKLDTLLQSKDREWKEKDLVERIAKERVRTIPYSSFLLALKEKDREWKEKVLQIISIEPAAIIPRTKEHLEAYRNRLETRNQFRKELKEEIYKFSSTKKD